MRARGYFCGTVGEVDEKTIKEYIENLGIRKPMMILKVEVEEED